MDTEHMSCYFLEKCNQTYKYNIIENCKYLNIKQLGCRKIW